MDWVSDAAKRFADAANTLMAETDVISIRYSLDEHAIHVTGEAFDKLPGQRTVRPWGSGSEYKWEAIKTIAGLRFFCVLTDEEAAAMGYIPTIPTPGTTPPPEEMSQCVRS